MRIDGEWRLGTDLELRPMLRAEAQAADGSWVELWLLVDIGADRTVLNVDVWQRLGVAAAPAGPALSGVGGDVPCVLADVPLRVSREDGSPVLFRGPFNALTGPSPLDLSLLGRDILCHFAVIADQPQRIVCLLHKGHRYQIVAE